MARKVGAGAGLTAAERARRARAAQANAAPKPKAKAKAKAKPKGAAAQASAGARALASKKAAPNPYAAPAKPRPKPRPAPNPYANQNKPKPKPRPVPNPYAKPKPTPVKPPRTDANTSDGYRDKARAEKYKKTHKYQSDLLRTRIERGGVTKAERKVLKGGISRDEVKVYKDRKLTAGEKGLLKGGITKAESQLLKGGLGKHEEKLAAGGIDRSERALLKGGISGSEKALLRDGKLDDTERALLKGGLDATERKLAKGGLSETEIRLAGDGIDATDRQLLKGGLDAWDRRILRDGSVTAAEKQALKGGLDAAEKQALKVADRAYLDRILPESFRSDAAQGYDLDVANRYKSSKEFEEALKAAREAGGDGGGFLSGVWKATKGAASFTVIGNVTDAVATIKHLSKGEWGAAAGSALGAVAIGPARLVKKGADVAILLKNADDIKHLPGARLTQNGFKPPDDTTKFNYTPHKAKHGNEQRGNVSPRPEHDEVAYDALRNRSVPVKADGNGRVGLDVQGNIIVFKRQAKNGVEASNYHGFQVKFADLRPDEQRALLKAGMVDKKGRPKA